MENLDEQKEKLKSINYWFGEKNGQVKFELNC